MPCSVCGRLMWRGSSSLPEGQAICHPCRRKAAGRKPDERAAFQVWVPADLTCPTCGHGFTQRTHNQRFCSPQCRPYSPSRHGDKAARAERGYGPEHSKTRRWFKTNVVDKGNGYCWRCGVWLDPKEPWDLGHDDYDRSVYRGPECRPCNRGTAASRGNRSRRSPGG